MRNRPLVTVLVLFVVLMIGVGSVGAHCFTVLVGAKASASGAVLLAHNEDDHPRHAINLLKVPHLRHRADESVSLLNGGSLPQISETAAYIWFEMPDQHFADCFLNEYGVAIVSNQCQSRVREDDLSKGGITDQLRRLMAERAHSAREAVELAGRLIETFGYDSSGRSYSIADSGESWMLSVVRGRVWVAARIPDDEVAVLSNHYTIETVDLSDPARFLANPRLVEYAQTQGFYDAARDGAFDFSRAYGAPGIPNAPANLARQWRGYTVLSGKTVDPGGHIPFTFKPREPVSVEDLKALLRDHFEGSQFEMPRSYNHGNPHDTVIKRICSDSTQYGLVAELSSSRPVQWGDVLWFAPRRPCIQPFIPIFTGVRAFPQAFSTKTWHEAMDSPMKASAQSPPSKMASSPFSTRAAEVDSDYAHRIMTESEGRDHLEKAMLKEYGVFKTQLPELWKHDREEALDRITEFTGRWLKYLLAFNQPDQSSSEPSD